MCNRYTPSRDEAPFYRAWLSVNPTNYPPQPWSKLGPFNTGPFYRRTGVGEEVELVLGQWGLIRPGAPSRIEVKRRTVMRKRVATVLEEQLRTNNARSETMATKPTFRDAWAHGRRCIIPAQEFDEPCYDTGKNQWWLFCRADGLP